MGGDLTEKNQQLLEWTGGLVTFASGFAFVWFGCQAKSYGLREEQQHIGNGPYANGNNVQQVVGAPMMQQQQPGFQQQQAQQGIVVDPYMQQQQTQMQQQQQQQRQMEDRLF